MNNGHVSTHAFAQMAFNTIVIVHGKEWRLKCTPQQNLKSYFGMACVKPPRICLLNFKEKHHRKGANLDNSKFSVANINMFVCVCVGGGGVEGMPGIGFSVTI